MKKTAKIDKNKCVGCGLCVSCCTQDAVRISGGFAVIDSEKCVGCGLCVTKCYGKAISVI